VAAARDAVPLEATTRVIITVDIRTAGIRTEAAIEEAGPEVDIMAKITSSTSSKINISTKYLTEKCSIRRHNINTTSSPINNHINRLLAMGIIKIIKIHKEGAIEAIKVVKEGGFEAEEVGPPIT
jgi:hypothetical protein